MSTVLLQVSIDANKPNQVAAAMAFLTALSGQPAVETPKTTPEPETSDDEPEEKPAPKKKATRKPKAKPAPKKKPEPEPEDDEEEDVEAASASEYEIDQVRAKLATKVADYRKEIKAKLTDLGASNVTNLDASKYGDFMEFLEDLD